MRKTKTYRLRLAITGSHAKPHFINWTWENGIRLPSMLLQENKSGMLRTLSFGLWAVTCMAWRTARKLECHQMLFSLFCQDLPRCVLQRILAFIILLWWCKKCITTVKVAKFYGSIFLWSNFMIQGGRSRHTVWPDHSKRSQIFLLFERTMYLINKPDPFSDVYISSSSLSSILL